MNIYETKQKALTFKNVTVNSAAQAMTLIAYGDCNKGEKAEIPFRNLSFRCECENYRDFEDCINIIEDYNEFDSEEMAVHLRHYLDLKKYYSEGNPNNGNSFFRFEIAREGSPAFYISMNPVYDTKHKLGDNILPYNRTQFIADMNSLKRAIKADEMDIETGYNLTARFWFD